MNDRYIIDILQAVAIIVLKGEGAFFIGDRQEASWYSAHSHHPIIQVLPWKHSQPDLNGAITSSFEMYFIGLDPIQNLWKDTIEVIYSMRNLSTEYFHRLNNWNDGQLISPFEIINKNDEQMNKQYSACLTGWRVTFQLRYNAECLPEGFDEMLPYLLQESGPYILQENGGLIRIT